MRTLVHGHNDGVAKWLALAVDNPLAECGTPKIDGDLCGVRGR
jgi:hypothetical protein